MAISSVPGGRSWRECITPRLSDVLLGVDRVVDLARLIARAPRQTRSPVSSVGGVDPFRRSRRILNALTRQCAGTSPIHSTPESFIGADWVQTLGDRVRDDRLTLLGQQLDQPLLLGDQRVDLGDFAIEEARQWRLLRRGGSTTGNSMTLVDEIDARLVLCFDLDMK